MTKLDRHVPDGMVARAISREQQRVRALELAQVVQDIDQQRDDWAAKAKEHRQLIAELESRRSQLAEDVRTGTELLDAQGDMFMAGGLPEE